MRALCDLQHVYYTRKLQAKQKKIDGSWADLNKKGCLDLSQTVGVLIIYQERTLL